MMHLKEGLRFVLGILVVGVEKVDIRKNGVILGDRKCLGGPRKSFVGHPDATQFGDLFPQTSFSTATVRTTYCGHKGHP
jgi:hypothetical protein